MRKTLLFGAVLAIATSASAQLQRKAVQMPAVNKFQKIEKLSPVMENKNAKPVAISKVTESGAAEAAVKRPGGALWGGFISDVAGSYYYYPTLMLPAYQPITFGVSKDPDLKTGVDYWLGVQYYDFDAKGFDYYDNEAGEDITTVMYPSFGSYGSPLVSAMYNGRETVSYLLNDAGDYPAQLSVGMGSIVKDDGSGAQSCGNYDVQWDGGLLYMSGYFATNTTLTNMDAQYADQGVSNFRMTGIIEEFDAPQASFYVSGLTLQALRASRTCGNVNAALIKVNYDSDGYREFGDVIAYGVCTAPTDEAAYGNNTFCAFAFTDLYDANGNSIDGVVMEPGQAFALYFYLDDDDTTTQLLPISILHSEYMPDEYHAFGEYTFNYSNGQADGGIFSCNYVWETTDGSVYYQSSWACGLIAEYPYIYVEDGTYEVDYNGGTKTVYGESLYMLMDGETVNATLENGDPLPNWVSLSYSNYADEEGGAYNGIMSVDVTVAPNSGLAREANIKLQFRSASATIKVVQAANPTGIAEVTTDVNTEKAAVKYNLAGQKVSNNYRGLMIQNGKKFMKK